jgi:hypothetical protein
MHELISMEFPSNAGRWVSEFTFKIEDGIWYEFQSANPTNSEFSPVFEDSERTFWSVFKDVPFLSKSTDPASR